jgi:signal transduction histidine kinase
MTEVGFSPIAEPFAGEMMRIDRRRAAWFATIAVVMAAAALAVAGVAVPGAAVIAEEPGGDVVSVLPGGPAWRDSIRVGQLVVELDSGGRPEDWRLVTTDGTTRYASNALATVDELRSSLPIAFLALCLGGLAVGLVRARTSMSAALAATGIALATLPFLLVGDAVAWTLVAIGASLVIAAWLLGPGHWRRIRAASACVMAVVIAVWVIARFAFPPAYDPVEAARSASLIGAVVVGVGASIDLPTLIRRARHAGVPDRLDLLAAGALAAVLVAIRLVTDATWWVMAGLALIGILAYSRSRRALLAAADRVLMAEARERAAIEAIESERGRVARELHDVPLQELSGVIRSLELAPATGDEVTALRGVAAHLRQVAIELHPPHLQDLGLGAALEHLVRQANVAGAIPVELDLNDRTGPPPAQQRPPGDTELALYRIAQEAIANAQAHSEGSLVQVEATIETTRILIAVVDDGAGIDPEAVDAAQRANHFGLASMRQRAAAIGAELRLESGPGGTRVRVEWRQR